MTAGRSPTDIDPELSMRVQALSRQSRHLGNAWDGEQVQALYDESEQLAERAQAGGLVDLSEALLGLAAYLSSFVDSSMRPNDDQLAQLAALADASADALARYRAHIEIAPLGAIANEAPLLQATVDRKSVV